MNEPSVAWPIDILLVEDSPSDVELTREGLHEVKLRNRLHVLTNGVDAVAFLRRQGAFVNAPRPGLILLDLNLPRKSGREVLAEIKADESLKTIPVVVLTSSADEQDIRQAYGLHANCYVTKPIDFAQLAKVVRAIEGFWFSVVRLPPIE